MISHDLADHNHVSATPVSRNLTKKWAIFISFVLFAFATAAQAQLVPQIQSVNGICGGDLQGYGTCKAGEISISEVIDLEFEGNITECVNGQPLTISSATVNYTMGTQERSDLILWLADQEGVDPRNAAGVGESCSAYSLPGPFGNPPDLNNPFGDVDGDQCGDLSVNVATAARTFTNITFNCQDNDDDGKADAQVLLTWDVANNNEFCGTGVGQFPTAGPPSKCDYQLLNTVVDLVFAPRLTLIKTVVNNSGGSAAPTAWTLSATGPTPISGVTGTPEVTAVEVTEGAYTLGETGPAGYTGTWQCTGGGTLVNGVVTLSNANPVQATTCTLTNDDQPGTLTLVKNLITDNGSNSTLADWTLTATGPVTVTGLADSSSIVNQTVPAGTYALTENGPSGFNRSPWSCVGGTQNGANITIGLGQNVTCTITNDDIPPTLTLVKNVQNDFNGNAVADDWILTADGTTDYTGNTSFWTGGIVVAADTYTLSETGPDGYTPGAWQCTGGTQNGNQITIAIGQIVSCSITNTAIRPGLTLVKNVTNNFGGNDAANTFDLTLSGVDGVHNGGVDYQTGNMPLVLANTSYTVSEIPNTGYTLTGIVCLDDSNAQDVGTTFSLNEGQNVTCTFNNIDQAPALTLVKNVVNDDGGTGVSGDFTMRVTGAANCGGQDGTIPYVDIGSGATVTPVSSNCTYTISEDPDPNYSLTGIACTVTGTATPVPYPVTLQEGQDVTCTVTNDDVLSGSITVIKSVINDQGGTAIATNFDLQVATGEGCVGGGTGLTSGYTIDTPTDGCQYTISETELLGYTQESIICTLAGSEGPPAGDTFTFSNGDTWNCVITNNDNGATLTLVKQVINDNGGLAAITDWTLNASGGPTPISGVSGSLAVTAATVSAGTYTLSETDGPPGYTPFPWVCSEGANLTGSSLVLTNGDNVTCLIANDDQAATLTLVKSLVQDNGGNEVADDWTLTATGLAVYQGNTTTWTGGLPVDADTYTLSETGPDGYTPSAWQCTGVAAQGDQLTLGLGQSAVCTITNNDIAPSLTLVKDVTNDNGGQAIPASFTLTLFGADGIHDPALEYSTGSTPPVEANVPYTVDELPLDGYTLDSIVCTDAAGAPVGSGGSLTLSLDQDVTCTVFNDDDAPTLVLNKVVTNDDTGDLVPADFDLTLTGADGTHAGGVNYVDGNMPVIDATVSYEVSETPPAGYELVSIECVDTDTQQALPNPFSPTSGQNISCTVTNDDIAPTLVLNKVVTNDDAGELLAEDFDLTLTGVDTVHDTGVDYVDGDMPVIVAGISYEVTETPPAGYELGTIECVDTDTQQAVGNPFTPVLGQNVSCTVNNDDIAPTLVLNKDVTNDNGGELTAADFDLTLTGEDTVHDAGVNYVDGNMPVIVAGTSYEVSETAPDGYELTGIECIDTDTQQSVGNPFIPTIGQNVSCTVSNDDISATLVLNKSVNNNYGGTLTPADFDLTLTGVDTVHDAGVNYVDGNMPTITAGVAYTVSETPPSGYELDSIVCVDTDTQQAVANPFTPALGQNLSCTITNDDIAPTLVLSKRVVNDDTGDLVPADFALTLTGADTVHDAGVDYASGDMPAIVAGISYEVSETPPSGYAVESIVCTDTDTQQVVANPFTPALDQNLSCIITNDDVAPTLVLTKAVINDDSGSLTPADFNLTLTGADTVHDSGVDYVSGNMPVIVAGVSYEVSEVAPDGYELVDIVCTDTDTQQAVSNPFTPELGQNVSCTITNDDKPAEAYFRVRKFFSDGNPQEVRVKLSCNNGQPTEQYFNISEGNQVNFVMTLYSSGDMDCTVTEETDLAGYSSEFEAGIIDGEAGDVYETEDPNTCHYEDVVGGQFYCDITNNVEPVDVTVHKIWEVNQYSGNVTPDDTTIVIWCSAEIEDGYYDSTVGYWYKSFDIVGDTTSIAGVLPEYPSSICWATENIAYSEVEVDNECGDSADNAKMTVSAGLGDECTITNTVFFEGIPTLNQFGLMLLVILTLGIGAVGVRRFS